MVEVTWPVAEKVALFTLTWTEIRRRPLFFVTLTIGKPGRPDSNSRLNGDRNEPCGATRANAVEALAPREQLHLAEAEQVVLARLREEGGAEA